MKMTLAEAIRLGSEGKETIEGDLFFMTENNVILGCCTMGAAMIGALGENQCVRMKATTLERHIRRLYPTLDRTDLAKVLFENLSIDEPEPHGSERDLYGAIAYINDHTALAPSDIAKGLDAIGAL